MLIQRCRAAKVARANKAPVVTGARSKVLVLAQPVNEPSITSATVWKFVVIRVGRLRFTVTLFIRLVLMGRRVLQVLIQGLKVDKKPFTIFTVGMICFVATVSVQGLGRTKLAPTVGALGHVCVLNLKLLGAASVARPHNGK